VTRSSTTLEPFLRKLYFYEQDNQILKNQIKDKEMSLTINKNIIESLVKGTCPQGEIQKIILKL
jgi:hypothetical protein